MRWKNVSVMFLSWAVLSFLILSSQWAYPEGGQASKPYEYFSNPWTVVGLKDYRDGTRIAPDGTLFLGEGVKCRFLTGKSYSPLPASIVRTLEKDSVEFSGLFQPEADFAAFDIALPVVHLLLRESEGVSYEFIIFASPLNPVDKSSYDHPVGSENYLNQVCIRIRSELSRPIKAPVGISLSRAIAAPRAIGSGGGVDRYVCEEKGKLVLLMGLPVGTSTEKVGDSLRWKVPLPKSGVAELYFIIPYTPIARGETVRVVPLAKRTPEDTERKVAPGSKPYFLEVHRRTKQFWQDLLQRGAKIGVPEQKPSLTYYASLIYNFIGRDGMVIKPGEGFYDNFYLRDGAFQVHALDLAGFSPEAEESLAHFAEFQKPDGQFISQRGELDGNGQALWGLYAHYALTGDRGWLRDVYPAATKALSWLRRARQTEARLDAPYYGILFASIADGESLMQTEKHIVGYDFWNLHGVDCVARMAKALGKESDAEEHRQLFQTYKASVENALRKAGANWFPPSYEGVGTSWGNLTMLHPTLLFDPLDPRVTATLDRVRGGFVEGTIRWSPEKMRVIHPYMSTYVTNSEIIRGEREKAVDHFYHLLAHTTSTHGFPEGVYYETRTAWNNTVPHLWAAAQYIIVLRNMLFRSDGEVLHLLPAVPAAWLRPGKRIVVVGAPTVFGKVSFAIKGVDGGAEVRFSWPDRTAPKRVILHMPPRLSEVVKCLSQPENETIPVEKDAVVLPKGCKMLRIEWTLPPAEKDRTFTDYAREYQENSPL